MISFLFRLVFIYLTYARATVATSPEARSDHSSILYNNAMVMFGGWDGSNRFNDAWTLDLTSDTWEKLETSDTKPSARSGHSSIAYDGKMIMFGGWDGSEKNDVWTLKLTKNEDNKYAWNEIETSGTKPSARNGHSSILYDGQMVTFGGYDRDTNTNGQTKILDLSSYTWEKPTMSITMPSARNGHSSIVYDGKMIMFGGHDGSYKKDAWKLDLVSYEWTELGNNRRRSLKEFPRYLLQAIQRYLRVLW